LRKGNLRGANSFKPILTRAQLPDLRLYDLRHTSATLLLLAEKDAKFETAFELALGDAPGTFLPYNGNVALWQQLFGGIGRGSLEDAFATMPQTPAIWKPRAASSTTSSCTRS
jgi:hypothetical protein